MIRDARLDDATSVTTYRSDPLVTRFQRWNPTVDEFRASIERQAGQPPFSLDDWHLLVIELRSTGETVGDVGVFRESTGDVLLGITVAPEFQRRGFAIEALTVVCPFVFERCDAQALIARIDPANEASLALFDRLGFVEDIRVDGEVTMRLRKPRLRRGHPSTGSG